VGGTVLPHGLTEGMVASTECDGPACSLEVDLEGVGLAA